METNVPFRSESFKIVVLATFNYANYTSSLSKRNLKKKTIYQLSKVW